MKYKRAGVNLGLLILILGGGFFLPRLLLVLMPFILGWIFSLIIDPPICFLENKLKIKRKAGSVLVITLVIVLICTCFGFLLRILSQKAEELLFFLPQALEDTRAEIKTMIIRWKSLTSGISPTLMEKAEEMVKIMGRQMKKEMTDFGILQIETIEDRAKKIPGKFLFLCLILLSSCCFAIEKEKTEKIIFRWIPKDKREKFIRLRKTAGEVLGSYLKVQLRIELWIYLLLVAGFFILKIEYGVFAAVPIAVLDMFPVFGTGLILLPWAGFSLIKGSFVKALGLGILWIGTLVVRQMIQPKMIGKTMGIGTLPSLILLYLGYQWAGLAGMFFAVPLGILVRGMNEAGFFENSKLSIKILWMGMERFRSFSTKEEDEKK